MTPKGTKLVSFETAKLAHKRDFDWYCVEKFNLDGKLVYHDNGINIAAPSQDQLQSWLEAQNKYINIVSEFYQNGINWNWQVLWYTPKEEWKWVENENSEGVKYRHPQDFYEGTGWYGDNGEFPTRHDAIEAAIVMALNKMDFLYRNNSIDQLAKLYSVDQKTFITQLREFSKELGDWGFRDLTPLQLEIIVSKLGKPAKSE